MALQLTTTNRDTICLQAFGTVYSSCTAQQKALTDSTGSVPTSTPTGLAGAALTIVYQYAQWFQQTGSATGPDPWEQWFIAETVYKLIQSTRPERASEFLTAREQAMEAALAAFSSAAIDSSTTPQGQTFSYQSIRLFVIDHCIRRRPARVFPSVPNIDAATQWVLDYVWRHTGWNFKRRQCQLYIVGNAMTGGTWTNSTKTLTINSTGYTHVTGGQLYVRGGTGAVIGVYDIASKPGNTSLVLATSLSGSGGDLATGDITCSAVTTSIFGLGASETFDTFSSRRFYYTDSSYAEVGWANADDISKMLSSPTAVPGRPQVFRHERRAAFNVFQFYPIPDQAYQGRFEANIAPPAAASSASDTAPFDAFPSALRPIIRDMVLARVLRLYNVPGWTEAWASASDQLEISAPQYDRRGEPEQEQKVRDAVQDPYQMGLSNQFGGIY